MLRYLTAGESHGKVSVDILEGLRAGLKIDPLKINYELRRRQEGFGRGKRMQIEKDRVEILSGLKNNTTLGSPIALLVKNKDFSIEKLHKVLSPRPGLSLIQISEPTRLLSNTYAVFCLKKKKQRSRNS